MNRVLFTLIAFTVFNVSAWAERYTYQARIEGMVCAFCAYNVGKTIGTLPGVNAESVTVNLESKIVDFNATAAVEQAKVSAAFSESGFTLTNLDRVENPPAQSKKFSDSPVVSLLFDDRDAGQFEDVLKSLGAVASNQQMRMVIEAPASAEIDLLMPILMGRRPAINVQFIATDAKTVQLKMFAASQAY